jgi:mevalonate kinase
LARAHGKVILFGEHAVVYGVPAIAVGISAGADARALPAAAASISIGDFRARAGDGSELALALEALLAALGAPPHALEVELGLPAGAGLGASAALGVAIARAVLEALGELPGEARVLRAAAAWEGVFHGSASGIDAAAAFHGGCLWYSRGDGARPLEPGAELSLAIALAGPPAPTRSMVESVARLKSRRPELVDKALAGIRALVENARLSLEAGDRRSLGQLMDLNHMILSGLFLSTEGIETTCTIAREAGALGAKLTGAGGGGAVVALVEDDAEPVLAAWRAAGLHCFAARVAPAAGGR